jgi:hypothetical protein
MKKLALLKSLSPLLVAAGIFLIAIPSYAYEVATPAMKARATHIKVHSINHQTDWARGLVYIYPTVATPAGHVAFYAASDPQMFQLLMTAVQIDANIIIKYETTTGLVTSIEFQ